MTDKYLVFGNPVEHSLSPQLHTFFATCTHQDLEYTKCKVEEGKFKQQADEFFSHGGLGCNITVPCKIDAYNYADELTDYAKAAGAVNTLKKLSDGRILGDNTDGRGLVYDLKRLNFPLQGAKILIIGAGGAAKGILKPIVDCAPLSVTIANRTYEKAVELARDYKEVSASTFDNLSPVFNIIINATSSSLKDELPKVADEVLKNASFVYDLMYKKTGQTVFTQHAKELLVPHAYDGFGMLIGQALLSFELWRGVKPDFEKTLANFR